MGSYQFLGGLILILLILLISTILLAGFYFLCRAVCYKARHVPRRHFKCWVPNILNGIRPSRSSEMIFAENEQEVGLVEERIPGPLDQLQECPDVFSEGISAVVIPNQSWDEANIKLLGTFATDSESKLPATIVRQDSSIPPTIIPSVHSF